MMKNRKNFLSIIKGIKRDTFHILFCDAGVYACVQSPSSVLFQEVVKHCISYFLDVTIPNA